MKERCIRLFFLFVFILHGTMLWAQTESASSTEVSVSSHWLDQRFARKCAAMERGGIDVIMIGDSITHLWTWDKPNDPANEPLRGDVVWAKYFNDPAIFNFAFDCETTQSAIARLNAAPLEKIHPRVAVVMIGSNNVSGGETPDKVADGIIMVVERLRLAFPEIKIILHALTPMGKFPEDPRRVGVTKSNEILRSRVKKDDFIIFLDIGSEFINSDGTLSAELQPDYDHFSPKGYEIWANRLKPILDTLRR